MQTNGIPHIGKMNAVGLLSGIWSAEYSQKMAKPHHSRLNGIMSASFARSRRPWAGRPDHNSRSDAESCGRSFCSNSMSIPFPPRATCVQSPVGMIPAFSIMRMMERTGARVRCTTPFGTVKPWRGFSSTTRSSRSTQNSPSTT